MQFLEARVLQGSPPSSYAPLFLLHNLSLMRAINTVFNWDSYDGEDPGWSQGTHHKMKILARDPGGPATLEPKGGSRRRGAIRVLFHGSRETNKLLKFESQPHVFPHVKKVDTEPFRRSISKPSYGHASDRWSIPSTSFAFASRSAARIPER